jgi:hypothetical protein
VSPITFATSQPKVGFTSPPTSPPFNGRLFAGGAIAAAGGYDDSEDEFDTPSSSVPDIRKYRNKQQEYYKHAIASASMPSSIAVGDDPSSSTTKLDQSSQYVLISFSTGQLLEDDFTLSWYNLRQYELLELHNIASDMRLPRDIMHDYIQPIFEAKVKALRVVLRETADRHRHHPNRDNHESHSYSQESSGGKVGVKSTTSTAGGKRLRNRSELDSLEKADKKKKKTKLEWRERWAVIRHGIFTVCKDRSVRSLVSFLLFSSTYSTLIPKPLRLPLSPAFLYLDDLHSSIFDPHVPSHPFFLSLIPSTTFFPPPSTQPILHPIPTNPSHLSRTHTHNHFPSARSPPSET